MDKIKLLENIRDAFAGIPVDCELINDENITPEPTLFCDHEALGFGGENAIGQYFFVDFEHAAENTDYFMSVISLEDDLSEDYIDSLFQAVSYLNYYLTYGSFVISDENSLMFKLGVPLNSDMDQEKAEEYVNKIIAHSMEAFRRYIGWLVDVANGEMAPADIIELFGGDVDEEE